MDSSHVRQPIVRLEKICKSFGPVMANRNITLDLHAGKIKALLGENGAGKSTLMGVLAGGYTPDRGKIYIDGRPKTLTSTRDAFDAGIGMVYQHFKLVDAMTVAENVFLGQTTGFFLRPSEMVSRVRTLAKEYRLYINPETRVDDLSMGERQRVEILRLLLRQSRVLIFDEPTAVLTPRETDQLFSAMHAMADQKKAVVFISHKLDEVMSVADDVAILRKGEIVDETPIENIRSKADLASRMVGRDVVFDVPKAVVAPRQIILSTKNLTGNGLKGIDLQLRQGEILGLVGVAGNGQKPLTETICGITRPIKGFVRILGDSWETYYQKNFRENRLSYIPEDRQGLATLVQSPLTDNFLLTTRRIFSSGPLIREDAAYEKLKELIDLFSISPPDPDAPAGSLSGGNLQKLVIAREFFRRPRLIVAEQPTQGLDIAATEEVWRLLLKAREQAGVLLITGDLNEAFALSDRIGVMFDGKILDIFNVDDHEKREKIGLMMAGVSESH